MGFLQVEGDFVYCRKRMYHAGYTACQVHYAHDLNMQYAADHMGIDPVEFRKISAADPGYDYRRFAEDYEKGEEKAQRLFATISTALGAGALALVHLYDAETVIWSGGASHFALLLDAAQEYVWAHSWTPWGKVRFVVAENPEASVVLGLHALFAKVGTKREVK